MIAIALVFAMVIDFNKIYAETDNAAAKTNNINTQNILCYGSSINSYLNKCDDGTFERIEYSKTLEKVVIEKYDNNFNLISQRYIDPEMNLFGAYYNDGTYNYICYGRTNEDEEPLFEAICVAVYNKNWEKIKAKNLKLRSCYIPFYDGVSSMTEKDGTLYISYTELLCTSSDGLRHHCGETVMLSLDTMELVSDTANNSYYANGFQGHNWQRISAAGPDEYVYVAGLSDTHPKRGLTLMRFNDQADCYGEATGTGTGYINLLSPIWRRGNGNDGLDNYTATGIGGVDTGAHKVIVAANSVGEGAKLEGARNIYIWSIDRSDFKKDTCVEKKLTSYSNDSDESAGTPHLTKVSDNKWLVSWSVMYKYARDLNGRYPNEYNYQSTNQINFTFIDEDGNMLTPIQKMEGYMSSRLET